jgi:co-chaperonin GroES (HSP10)
MQAYGKNLILRPIKGKDRTDTGLWIPSDTDTKNTCDVVSIGPEVDKELDGKKVIFRNANSFTYRGVDYFVCKEEEILVVLG